MQRRQDIFMAGSNEIDGSEWVCSMGLCNSAIQANSCPQGATHRAAVVSAAESLKDGFT